MCPLVQYEQSSSSPDITGELEQKLRSIMDMPGYEGERLERQYARALEYAEVAAADSDFLAIYQPIVDEVNQIRLEAAPAADISEVLINMVAGEPYRTESTWVRGYSLLISDTPEVLYQNKTFINILGHRWSEQRTRLTPAEIQDDAYTSLGRTLLLDAWLKDNHFRASRSTTQLQNLVLEDIYATMLHLARGGKTYYSSMSRSHEDDGIDIIKFLLQNNEDPQSLLHLLSNDAFQNNASLIGNARDFMAFSHDIFQQDRERLFQKIVNHPSFDSPVSRILKKEIIGEESPISSSLFCLTEEFIGTQPSEQLAAEALRARKAAAKQFALSNPTPKEVLTAITGGGLDAELIKLTLGWQPHQNFAKGTSETLVHAMEALVQANPALLESRYPASSFMPIARVERYNDGLTVDMRERLEAFRKAHETADTNRQKETERYGESEFWDAQEVTIKAIQDKVKQLHAEAKQRMEYEPEKAKQIQFQIDQLETLVNYNFDDFPAGIAGLAKYKKHIGHELMTLLLDDIPYNPFMYRAAANLEGAQLEAVIETMRHDGAAVWIDQQKGSLSKQDVKAIKDLMSTKAFDPLFVEETSDKSIDIQFMPTRGVLLEASGHIAGTCWAEQAIITRDHPNIDAIMFVQRPNESSPDIQESFAGCCLVIRTTATDGTPLLVIRGLNPSNPLTERVDLDDFYTKLTAYVKEIAAQEGRQAAIVIDDHAGRSASNRPAMFDYLSQQAKHLKKVPVPAKDTTFNGYDITAHTYLV